MDHPIHVSCDSCSTSITTDLELSPLVDSENEKIETSEQYLIPKKSIWQSCFGLMLAVLSSFMFSVCSILVKILDDVNEWELAIFRFVGVLIPSLPLLIYSRYSPYPKGFRLKLLMRGIFGTASLMMQFYAFRHMPLADASVIVFSAPAIVAVLARIFLKEPCGRFQIFLILLTLSGVFIITRPPALFGELAESYTKENWYGAGGAMIGTVMAASSFIFLRALKSIHYSVIMTDFALIALFITPIITGLIGEARIPPCGTTRWLIILMGALSFLGQILLTKALQLEEAGPVSIARTTDVVFAFIWQIVFLGVKPDVLTIIGASLVTSCVLLLGVRRWAISLSEGSKNKRRLQFLIG